MREPDPTGRGGALPAFDGTGNCATRNVTLNAAKRFDGLTGLGVPGKSFIPQLSKF